MRSRYLFLVLSLAISAGCLCPSLAANKRSCPVTKPSDHPFVPPPPYKSTVGAIDEFWYGTPALWTLIDPSWRVGRGGQKLPYFRQGYDWMKAPSHPLTVAARRLDSNSPLVLAVPYHANNGYIEGEGVAGMFMVTGVDIPSSGCWEIAAHYLGRDSTQTLTYTVWVEP